jgi:DNA polymerase-3 subunit delta
VTPDQFLREIEKNTPRPVYLFLGPEGYMRRKCRTALAARVLPDEERSSGITTHDLDETTLNAVLDDARSFSLFSSNRLLWVASAESALPRGRAGAGEQESAAASLISAYLKNPTPGTVVVFDAGRFDFEGDDKAKIERVQKFYGTVPDPVEFRAFSIEAARTLAGSLAKQAGLNIGAPEIGLLVESLGADAGRIAMEIEKLSLFAAPGQRIGADDIARLSPNAQTTNLFVLVNALGRGDRQRSLQALDTLLREGEYLPLALAFLGTQFRLALAAQEAGAVNASQIQAHFTKQGIRIWRDRAEQIAQTMGAFPKARLERAIEKVFEADKALRDARPDDRVVLEEFVLKVTAN